MGIHRIAVGGGGGVCDAGLNARRKVRNALSRGDSDKGKSGDKSEAHDLDERIEISC